MIEASSCQKSQQDLQSVFPSNQQQQYSKKAFFQKIVKSASYTTVLINQEFECPRENVDIFLSRNIYSVEAISYISKGCNNNFNITVNLFGESIYKEKQKRKYLYIGICNLSSQLQASNDELARAKIKVNLNDLEEKYSKLSQRIVAKERRDNYFCCRHLALNALFNWCDLSKIVNFEEFKTCSLFRTYNSESSSYELNYQRSFEKMEGLYNKISNGCFYSSVESFDRKATLQDLTELKYFLNIRGYNQQADKIDKIFNDLMLSGYSLNERLANIPGKDFNNLFADINCHRDINIFFDSKYPRKNSFFEYQNVYGYVSNCSVNSFTDFLYKKSLLVSSKPLGHIEDFLIFTNSHVMKFTIKKKNYGLKFKFYDPNYSCTTKNIIVTNINEVKKIQLMDILYKAYELTLYDFLINDDCDLQTMQFIQILPEVVSKHQLVFNEGITKL